MKKDKWETAWRSVLRTIEIQDGEVCPVTKATVNRYKKGTELPLPNSYYGYCRSFGPGYLTHWAFAIYMPYLRKTTAFGIEKFRAFVHDLPTQRAQSEDTDQHQRAIYFARDIRTSWFFWDPNEVTDRKENEYGIYIINRERRIYRLADTFWGFINNVCLGTGIPEYDYSEGINRGFSPVT